MKLCIAGKNNIAVDTLYFSLSILDKSDICVILDKGDQKKNAWQKSLGFHADKENIEISTIEKVQKIKNITFLSLEFDQIIKPKLFHTNKIYNIHFSLLPEYKGMYTSIFPILHNKQYSGVTLHEINNGIDTGNIIEQISFSISGLTGRELYSMYLKNGTGLICKNLLNLLNKNYISFKQPILNSTYYSKSSFNFSNRNINPRQTAFQIHQFVSALTFRAYQMPSFKNQIISRTQLTSTKSVKKSGTIIKESPEKIVLSTIDFNIILYKDYYEEFMGCCKRNNLERALQIIDYIFDIDELDSNGWNFLMVACYHNSYDVVKLLIEKNANVNASNLNGTTILMYAKEAYLKNQDDSIISLILSKGGNIEAKDIYKKTILDYCLDKKLVALLTNN